MNDEEIIGQIAYLDSGIEEVSAANFSTSEMLSLVRAAIQIEMAKHGYLRKAADLSGQISSLEKRVELVQQELMRRRRAAAVVYVSNKSAVPSMQVLAPVADLHFAKPKLPRLMICFYAAGLICSLVFATLLALSTMRIETIHPLISLLGLIGGLGWLTTAWTDLLLWKRERPIGNRTAKTEGSNAA